jgi:peptidoglycan/LPS O-acetylase OafA/YrhL
MVGLNGVAVPGLADNDPLWSLAYEIWFYVLGGALGYLFSAGRGKVPFLGILVLGACVVVFLKLDAMMLVFWLAGAATILLWDIRHRRMLAVLGLTVAVLGTGLCEATAASRAYEPLRLAPYLTLPLIVFGICLMLPACGRSRVISAASSLGRLIRLAAGFSYSLYLIHMPILFWMAQWLPKDAAISAGSLGRVALRIAICVLAAFGFYWVFERNTAAVRRYLKRKMPSTPALAPQSV